MFPIARFAAPTIGAVCSRLFINHAPFSQNLHVAASMALCRGDKLDRAMAMLVVVPGHVLLYPITCIPVAVSASGALVIESVRPSGGNTERSFVGLPAQAGPEKSILSPSTTPNIRRRWAAGIEEQRELNCQAISEGELQCFKLHCQVTPTLS